MNQKNTIIENLWMPWWIFPNRSLRKIGWKNNLYVCIYIYIYIYTYIYIYLFIYLGLGITRERMDQFRKLFLLLFGEVSYERKN